MQRIQVIKVVPYVNDDPDQNVVLCDGGMPYYEPPDYRADELTWQTVYGNQKNRLVV